MKDVPELPNLWSWLKKTRSRHHIGGDESPTAPRVTVSSYEPTTFNGVLHKLFQEDDYGKTKKKPKCEWCYYCRVTGQQ